MKTKHCLPLAAALGIFAPAVAHAQEDPEAELAALEQTAAAFVTAYNDKDAAAIAALFTEQGEMTGLTGDDLVTGRDAIKSLYEQQFAESDHPSMALEVTSVRLVAPNLAVEDGTLHLTPPGENQPPRSTTYTAALLKDASGDWKIASTRTLQDVTGPAGQLAGVKNALEGDWTCVNVEGVRLDLAFGWDPTGSFVAGEMLSESSGGEPQRGAIRIGWNAARQQIVSWIFDGDGGVVEGRWTPTVDGWIIRAEGTTAEGEATTATQELTVIDQDTLLWSLSDRVIGGDQLSDAALRIVRRAPDPTVSN